MLHLLFKAGDDLCVLDARRIREVAQLVNLQALHGAPACLAGICIYRGVVIPVLDAGLLTGHQACPRFLSTRIAMVSYAGEGDGERIIGVMAASATEMVDMAETDFASDAIPPGKASWCDGVGRGPGGVLYRVNPDGLLPPEMKDILAVLSTIGLESS